MSPQVVPPSAVNLLVSRLLISMAGGFVEKFPVVAGTASNVAGLLAFVSGGGIVAGMRG